MATQKQINFFDELVHEQGRKSRVGSINDLSVPEAWEEIQFILTQTGTSAGNEEFNKEIVDSFNEAKSKNFGKKETKKDNADNADKAAGFDIEWLTNNANDNDISVFTNNHEEAMWIAPSGRLIDGNFQDGFRNLDHRNALEQDDYEGIEQATQKGAVRVMNEYKTIQTSNGTLDELNDETKKQAEYYINNLGYELEKVE